ncbi:uncharacterized protein LOC141874600 [Acropora palmata]|uniref:uncharacterized protein LOC141874600 n=1 Tax=Acropora palmata TaxID=6131 RepID=UPI003D9FE043
MPTFASGLKTARKKSRPARKSSHRVSLCDGIRWKPTKCDTYTYEENTLLKKKEPQKENHGYRSASLPNDTNSIGVINEGLHASVLDRCKEPAPVNGSTKRVPLPFKTEANRKPVLNSGFNTARKESCPPRIMTRVNFCDETQQKPTECKMNEEKMPQEEKEPPNQSFQSSSSSLLSDPYRTGVVNKGFSVSFLDLYSDDESNYTGRVSKETAPINPSAVSLETKNDLLPDTKANSQVAINSELNTANKKNRPSRKRACVTFWDEIPSTPPKDDTNESQTLSNEEEAPIDNLQSWSSSLNNPDFTGVVSKRRYVSFLERYSDDRESTGTSRASKESSPSDVSALSLDTKSVSFSQTTSDRNPVVK